ncbi:AAA family ATPase [Turicibacter sanguinis]|uniref:AAA family ATPase n=1 Tax=Turicibacter sanguinis TaxID=154288 RepID=UPI0018ABFD8C|nr:ATP-binding protein [Turicibacter sanguinis]MDB8553318.1 ATP-binding protein [Turicibacter sanguinis]
MLLEFNFENFGPFEKYMEFSLKPGKVTKRFIDNVVENKEGLKSSKVCVIAGENAGGKTHFIQAIKFLKDVIEGEAAPKAYKQLCYNYDDSKIQTFEIKVILGGIIYIYNLKLDGISLVSEYLALQKKNSKDVEYVYIAEREEIDAIQKKCLMRNSYNSTKMSKEELEIIDLASSKMSNRLRLAVLYDLNISVVQPLVNWIKNQIMTICPGEIGFNIYKKFEEEEEDFEIVQKESFLEIFQLIDSSIEKLEIDKSETLFTKTKIIRKREDGTIFIGKLEDDSSGVKEYFAWSIALWKVIYMNNTLFADEIDRVLNAVLASKIVAFIKGQETLGQFIFTTHNIYHLNTHDFMKEQIYFVHKEKETLASELYCLSDFDYNYNQPKVYELYLKGLLGAIPNE